MPSFSQRQGHAPLERDIQIEEVDVPLRNGLWTAIDITYWRKWAPIHYNSQSEMAQAIERLCSIVWLHLFKEPYDRMPPIKESSGYTKGFIPHTRIHFFDCNWNEVYDLIEFLLKHGPKSLEEGFSKMCNNSLRRENSAYQIINGEVVPLTNSTEIKAIEMAGSSQYHNVNEHFSSALHLLSDRQKPDYRNSIKESISALESLCKVLCGNPKATLGQAIKKIPDLHPAFVQGISSLYGYTNDANGIRHALMEKSKVTCEDANFMLVGCSGLVNYLIATQTED